MIFLSVFNFKSAVGTVPINQKCLFVSKNSPVDDLGFLR